MQPAVLLKRRQTVRLRKNSLTRQFSEKCPQACGAPAFCPQAALIACPTQRERNLPPEIPLSSILYVIAWGSGR